MLEWCPRSCRKTDLEQGRSRQAILSCGHELFVSEMLPLGNKQRCGSGTRKRRVLRCWNSGKDVKEHKLRSSTICTSRVSSHCRDTESAVSTLTLATRSNGDKLRLKENVVHHSATPTVLLFVVSVFQPSVFCCVLVYRFNSSVFLMLFSVFQFFKMLRVSFRFFFNHFYPNNVQLSCVSVGNAWCGGHLKLCFLVSDSSQSLFVCRVFSSAAVRCPLLTAPSLRDHIYDHTTSALVSAERTVLSLPRTSLCVLTALSRPSPEALDVQAVRETFPLTTLGNGAELTEPDDGGNGPSEDIFRSSDKETQASPTVPTHRVGSSTEAQRLAVQHAALGDENAVSTGAIRHVWASTFLVECGDALEFHTAASGSLSLSLLCSGLNLNLVFRVSGSLGSVTFIQH